MSHTTKSFLICLSYFHNFAFWTCFFILEKHENLSSGKMIFWKKILVSLNKSCLCMTLTFDPIHSDGSHAVPSTPTHGGTPLQV